MAVLSTVKLGAVAVCANFIGASAYDTSVQSTVQSKLSVSYDMQKELESDVSKTGDNNIIMSQSDRVVAGQCSGWSVVSRKRGRATDTANQCAVATAQASKAHSPPAPGGDRPSETL